MPCESSAQEGGIVAELGELWQKDVSRPDFFLGFEFIVTRRNIVRFLEFKFIYMCIKNDT
jgi:hypothetical protein